MLSTNLLWLFLAGGLGTLARYALATLVQRWTNSTLPWGTLTVNILGCLLFGIIVSLASQREQISEPTRLMILVGFLGAFTTFSSFAYEAGSMIHASDWALACWTIAAHNCLGITAFLIGSWLATKL